MGLEPSIYYRQCMDVQIIDHDPITNHIPLTLSQKYMLNVELCSYLLHLG